MHSRKLERTITRSRPSTCKNFHLEDELLYFVSEPDHRRLCIPANKQLRLQILHDHHDAAIAGHFGIDKTHESIHRLYFWPRMARDIMAYVNSCDSCQRNKSSNRVPAGLLQPLPVPKQSWETISMDFITQLPPTRRGHDAIMVVVDK